MADTIERLIAETVEPPTPGGEEIGCIEHRSGDVVLCPVADVALKRGHSKVTVDGVGWVRSDEIVDVQEVR